MGDNTGRQDFSTLAGARRVGEQLQEYWMEKGYKFQYKIVTLVEKFPDEASDGRKRLVYTLTSNMVNGLPTERFKLL